MHTFWWTMRMWDIYWRGVKQEQSFFKNSIEEFSSYNPSHVLLSNLHVLEACYLVCKGVLAKALYECKQKTMLHLHAATPTAPPSPDKAAVFPLRVAERTKQRGKVLHVYCMCGQTYWHHQGIHWLTPTCSKQQILPYPHIHHPNS